MPRRPRLTLPEIPVHVIQRGNNRQACFYADEDYRFYLNHLREQSEKAGCAVHAYCLMTNHVHLLLTPKRAESVGQMMKGLGQRYVQYINRTYQRSGTVSAKATTPYLNAAFHGNNCSISSTFLALGKCVNTKRRYS